MLPHINQRNFDKIRKAFISSQIYPRIIFLGSHGSAIYRIVGKNSESDYDLEIVLDVPEPTDLSEIREIIDKLKMKIECQLRYLNEISGNGLIRKTKYKLFMYFVYANGITLLGQNIYHDLIRNIKEKDAKESFILSAQ